MLIKGDSADFRIDEPVRNDVSQKEIDAVLYQAIFDEVIRLRKSTREKERENIRCFLVTAYQLFLERMSGSKFSSSLRKEQYSPKLKIKTEIDREKLFNEVFPEASRDKHVEDQKKVPVGEEPGLKEELKCFCDSMQKLLHYQAETYMNLVGLLEKIVTRDE